MIEELGYHVDFFGQKGHYGVALMSREPALEVIRGLPGDDDDSQKRLITGIYRTPGGDEITVMNGYFPRAKAVSIPSSFLQSKSFMRT